MFKNRIKTLVGVLVLSFFMINPVYAQGNVELYLRLILIQVTEIHNLLNPLAKSAISMLSPDNDQSSPTAQLQALLAQYGAYSQANDNTQLSVQPQFLRDYFNNSPPTNANSLTYTTLLNQPFNTNEVDSKGKPVSNDQSAYNYIKNASGMNLAHYKPSAAWKSSNDVSRYTGYYLTVMAIQTFNTYALSNVYAEYKNGLQLTNLQKTLKNEASQSDWFSTIASESMGSVFRQILMYTSQIYLLLIQMVEGQQQQLAAQSMTNTLLIMNNQTTEMQLYNNAVKSGS